MTKKEVLSQFKVQLTLFLDELISQFPTEGDLVICRIFMKDQIPIEKVVEDFIHKVMPYKDMITNRDEDFFLNHCTLFSGPSVGENQGTVNRFKTLWRSPALDDDDKEIVWQWFETFIAIVESYQSLF